MVRANYEKFYNRHLDDKPTDNVFVGLDAIGPIITTIDEAMQSTGYEYEHLDNAILICELLNRLTQSDEFRVCRESMYSYYIYQRSENNS